jgi:hypothetical protein
MDENRSHEWRTAACVLTRFPVCLSPTSLVVLVCLAALAQRTQLGFFYEAFFTTSFYFELVDMAEKFLLVALLAFLPGDAQIPVACTIVFLHMLLLLVTRPYIRKGDDRLALFAQTEVLMMLLAGWVSHKLPKMNKLTDTILSVCLIGVVCGVLLVFLIMFIRNLRKMIRRHQRNKRNKQLAMLQGADPNILADAGKLVRYVTWRTRIVPAHKHAALATALRVRANIEPCFLSSWFSPSPRLRRRPSWSRCTSWARSPRTRSCSTLTAPPAWAWVRAWAPTAATVALRTLRPAP